MKIINSTTWGGDEDKHCTSKTMGAASFFKALVSWDKKLANNEKLAVPSFELTKEFNLQSSYNENRKTYTRDSLNLKKEIMRNDGYTCKVLASIADNMTEPNINITIEKGFKRNFNQLNVELLHPDLPLHIVLFLDGLEFTIHAEQHCSAANITQALKEMGIKTRFMSPQSDVSCIPQFAHKTLSTLDLNKGPSDKSNEDNSERAAKNLQERNQDASQVDEVKALDV